MSLRRSSRTVAKVLPDKLEVPSGKIAEVVAPKKRGRKSKSSEDVATAAIAQNGDADSQNMPPPPSTPNKRRRMDKKSDSKAPPFTPTPSAIGLMTSTSGLGQNYSTGDVDDATPPPATRRAKPNQTNATLVTPGGTQVEPTYSTFEESPSKRAGAHLTTNKSLLDEASAHLIKVDPSLKPVIDQHHCRIFSPEGLAEKIDPFRSLVSGILAQQVSGAAAKSIKNKFIALFPPEACPTGFPPPSLVAKTDIATLRTAGLSQRKAEYVQGLAQKFDSGELTVKMLMEGTDEEVFEKLIAVRGLGAWSVEMFMCFSLKRMDVFSTGDLGVQRGMAAHAGRDVGKLKASGKGKWKYMSEKDMTEMSEKFAPYRSLFMWLMWRVEDVDVSAVQDNAEDKHSSVRESE